ncbi:glutathione S-transferase family protein [Jannaschia sp. Os4]|uniref:glutathione S-transferase family protein n=1 Tax=Jannaschia sp. Os4 TaxID=2807617 RepID=UPI00193A4207|nr:glutathione S-transferase family protein [Jannaschia sp. Os4]MBM2575471.1 glutathione S-transferase family protein [Jannaschia sp. Os4]
MQLYSSPASPFARKCRAVILEHRIADVEIRDVSASPMGGEAALNAANPTGKIPVLVREDGPAVYDSRVITRFLDAHAGGGLYPEGRIWDVLTLEANADAIMEAAVGMTYEQRFRGEKGLVWDEWLDKQWAKVARSLDVLEARGMPLLRGPLNMGALGMACALGYLDLRHDARGWRDGRPQLSAWEADMRERQCLAETAPA